MGRPRTTLTIYQGEDLVFEALWLDDDGDPVDLSGYTAHAQVRTTYFDEDVTLDFRGPVGSGSGSGSGDDGLAGWIEFTDEDGVIALRATAEITSQVVLPEQGGVWDLELTDGEGTVLRLLEGSAELSREVTKA